MEQPRTPSAQQPQSPPPQPGRPNQPPKNQKTKRKLTPRQIRNRRIALVCCLLLIVLLIAGIVMLLTRKREPAGPATPEFGTSAGAWAKNANGYYFNDEGNPIPAATLKGIDVSKYQGEVDWNKAKAAGIDFAVIRCGYGSEWNGEGSYAQDDEQWERNADACTALGIPFGAYIYSYATTEEQAQLEADHMARMLGLRAPEHEGLTDYTAKPYKLDYPVYYDLEDNKISGLFPEEMAALTKAFFTRLESYGYTGKQGVYGSLNWVRARFSNPAFDEWRDNMWIARFASELGYTGPYDMWQCSYTEPGAAYGVQSETVDIDFVMEEFSLTGISDAEGASFTNDTYKNELALAEKNSKATLLTEVKATSEDAQEIFWTSSDDTVATVSKKGVVKAVTKTDGSCTITGTLADGRQSTTATVRVGSITVPVFATANLRGQITNETIGLADFAALKAGEPDSILLDAGGSLQGSTVTSLTGGMDMTSAFSAVGYDFQCPGGWDLAYGTERLLADTATAAGPTLAANLRTAEGTPLFYRTTSKSGSRITNGMNYVIEEAGKKIGFFALAGTGCYAHAAELTLNDAAQAATEQVAALQAEGVDAIVCIAGPDLDYAEGAVTQVLKDLGVNALIVAANADTINIPAADAAWMLPAGSGLDTVLRLDLVFDTKGGVTVRSETLNAATLNAARANYSETKSAAYSRAADALDKLTAGDAEVEAQKLFTLAENSNAKTTISFGNYVAGVYEALADGDRDKWPADAAGISLCALAGGVKELETTGDIDRGTLLASLPGGERLQLVQTTTEAVRALIDSGAVSETYLESLKDFDVAEGPCLLVTDTATLRLLADRSYTLLRDYGDVYWDIRMNINDVTENFANDFTLPEAPTIGVGRGEK